MRSASMPIVTSSGTSAPLSRYERAFRPSGVPRRMCSRNMSPVAMWGTPMAAATAVAWVPFPAPGGPNKSAASMPLLLEDALVVAHRELRLHLPHRIERHTDDCLLYTSP